MNFSKPGELIKASRDKRMKRSVMTHLKKKGFKVGKVKHSGTFAGKSNALGQGGRAAQLKARGVPGGVIGEMARKVGAAPGQKNFHKKSMKRKSSEMNGSEMMAMKKSTKKKAPLSAHHHIHIHGKYAGPIHVHMKGSKVSGTSFGDESEQGTKLEHAEEGAKHFKKAHKSASSGKSFGDESIQGKSQERKEEGAKHFKKKASAHKCKGSMCKHASHKGKRAKKA